MLALLYRMCQRLSNCVPLSLKVARFEVIILTLLVVICLLADKAQAKNVDRPLRRTNSKAPLIPPPPPMAPLGASLLLLPGINPLLMSQADLVKHRDGLMKQLKEAQELALEQEGKQVARRDRCLLFDSLYKEGVVSKRELENTQEDLIAKSKDLESTRAKVASLKQEINGLNAYIKSIKDPPFASEKVPATAAFRKAVKKAKKPSSVVVKSKNFD